jgi:hypothetical protein
VTVSETWLSKSHKDMKDMVAAVFRTIFAQPDAVAVCAVWDEVRDQLAASFPKAGPLMDDAKAEVLAFAAFPRAHWVRIWSNNPLERINKEVKRRSRVVGIFPNEAAVIRLVGAVLADAHDEWQVHDRRYVSETSMTLLRPDRDTEPAAITSTEDSVLKAHHSEGLNRLLVRLAVQHQRPSRLDSRRRWDSLRRRTYRLSDALGVSAIGEVICGRSRPPRSSCSSIRANRASRMLRRCSRRCSRDSASPARARSSATATARAATKAMAAATPPMIATPVSITTAASTRPASVTGT